jgi:hypothetical protein
MLNSGLSENSATVLSYAVPREEETEMTENMPLGPEEIRRLNRALMEKVLDKAAGDPEWKQRLLDDPEAAINEAGFPEGEKIQQMQEASVEAEGTEVMGQQLSMNWACPMPNCKGPGVDPDTWVPNTL